ncbi:DUF1707 SHOCT-like domain-containing protein [Corynebacterium sp. H113]|uniref:DUF1707 SHOCT-like domain-containing protein n=1 Tax=Corynebacterium sp. H113 TaxID=3133419 RepID=UPI003099AC01
MSENPDLRVGDPERSQALDVLGEHFANGYLDLAEFEERTEEAAQAKMRSELDALFADLPGGIEANARADVARTDLARRGTGGVSGASGVGAVGAGANSLPSRASALDTEYELDRIIERGKKVERADWLIGSVTMIVFFLGLFVFEWSYFWLAFLVGGAAAVGVRAFYGLDDEDEDIYDELSEAEKKERKERLKLAVERRRELGK